MKIQNPKSFTLVELLVIVGILIVLIALSIPSFNFFQKKSDLNNSTEEIISTLRLAQNKTIASEGGSQWGVYFSTSTIPHQYILFKGSDYGSRDTSFDEIHKLPERTEVYEINLTGATSSVAFNRVVGTTNQFGNFSLRLQADVSKTKTIYIENSGQIGLISPLTPSETNRIKDSRHVHFNLGWSIQNSTALKFKFLKPDPDQVEIVEMSAYFDAGKTEFNWDNENSPFLVSGIKQVFQIHTYFLDAFNALLCIHRDRNNGKNTEEVIIYIVDGGIEKDIVHYLADADDTAEKGFYVFNSTSTEKQ